MPKSNGDTTGWLGGMAHFLLDEALVPNPGASLIISRLIDLLVIRTLRTWARNASADDKYWLGALYDSRISRALKAIHDQPFERWRVTDLAAIAGMSRSSCAERFNELVGEAPLRYQTRWCLSLAAAWSEARHVGYAPIVARSASRQTHL